MGYRLLTQEDAASLPHNHGALGLDIERAQRITDDGLAFDLIRVKQARRGSPGAQGALVVTRFDEGLVSLPGTSLRCDICAQVAYHVAALIDVSGSPATSLAVEKMRSAAFDLEQRSIINSRLIHLTRVLK